MAAITDRDLDRAADTIQRGHHHMLADQWLQELLRTGAEALRAERRLTETLRTEVIIGHAGRYPEPLECSLCGLSEWLPGEPEKHKAGCLAAPPGEETSDANT